MDISKQLENNEQRCRYGSACNVMRIMPGEQPLDGGQNIIGAIPVGAVIESFSVIAVGWGGDVIATIGTSSFPTTFFSGVTLVDSVSQANAQDTPVEMYFPEGEEIVCELGTLPVGTEGYLEFVIDYSELETQKGAYTA